MKAVKPTKSTPKQASPAAKAAKSGTTSKTSKAAKTAEGGKPAKTAARSAAAGADTASAAKPGRAAKAARTETVTGSAAKLAKPAKAAKAAKSGKTSVKSPAEPTANPTAEPTTEPTGERPAQPVLLPDPPTLNITGNPAADAELAANPFSLLTGMLLDQQFPMERAFAGPYVILQRLGADTLDPATIAAYDPEAFVKLCQGPPAVHRYPGAMAARIQELARIVLDEYDGDATKIWATGTAKEVVQRLRKLPGFGAAKATIFLALLGKRFGVKPRGWVTETGPLGKPTAYRSVADVVDADSLAKVRATKQELKKRAKQDKAG